MQKDNILFSATIGYVLALFFQLQARNLKQELFSVKSNRVNLIL